MRAARKARTRIWPRPLFPRRRPGLNQSPNATVLSSLTGEQRIRNMAAPRHLRVVAGFGDDSAAIRVTDEYHGAALNGDRPLGNRHVVCQKDGRILDDGDRAPGLLPDVADAFPTGPIH